MYPQVHESPIHYSYGYKKVGPWGPELIWYLATKCKMGRQQVVPAVYHHLKHNKWGVADLIWQS